jgi:hypothetical protein
MSDRQTYSYALAPGVDAEITIESANGEVTHEHIRMLGRYLAIYYEALGGDAITSRLMLPEPAQKKKSSGLPPCANCGKHVRAKEHRDNTCLYTPLKRSSIKDTSSIDEDDDDDDAKPLITPQQREAADVMDNLLSERQPRRPYVNEAGVLCIDVDHTAVTFDIQESRYTVLHPASPGTSEAGHIHEYRTGKGANIEHETLATCADSTCQRTIMMVEESTEGGTLTKGGNG